MTEARALVAGAVAGASIEQRRDDPARFGLAHPGAGREVSRVSVGQPATLNLALRLAAGALLLATAEVNDVQVSHVAQGTLRAPAKHPDIWARRTARHPNAGPSQPRSAEHLPRWRRFRHAQPER